MSRCLFNVRYEDIKPLQNHDDFISEFNALCFNIDTMEQANNKVFLDLHYQFAQTRLDLIYDYLVKKLEENNNEKNDQK